MTPSDACLESWPRCEGLGGRFSGFGTSVVVATVMATMMEAQTAVCDIITVDMSAVRDRTFPEKTEPVVHFDLPLVLVFWFFCGRTKEHQRYVKRQHGTAIELPLRSPHNVAIRSVPSNCHRYCSIRRFALPGLG